MDARIPFFVMTALTFVGVITNAIWDWITPQSKYYIHFSVIWCVGFVFSVLCMYGVIKIGGKK